MPQAPCEDLLHKLNFIVTVPQSLSLALTLKKERPMQARLQCDHTHHDPVDIDAVRRNTFRRQ